jgi:hypothetical protein
MNKSPLHRRLGGGFFSYHLCEEDCIPASVDEKARERKGKIIVERVVCQDSWGEFLG